MSVLEIVLWVGIGIVLLFNVIVYLIKYTRMEQEIARIKTLLETEAGKEALSAYNLELDKDIERLEKHAERFKSLNANKKTPSKWLFQGLIDPERILKEVAELLQNDKLYDRRKAVMKKLSQLPEKKLLWCLSQVEAIVDLATDVTNTADSLDELIDVELLKLKRDEEILKARMADYEARKKSRYGTKAEE